MNRRLTRAWIWFQAGNDAKKDLPSSKSKALGETERQIHSAATVALTGEHDKHIQAVNPVIAKRNVAARLHDIASRDFNRLAAKAGREEIRTEISRTVHMIAMIVISIGEGVFNLNAFNILREPGWKTILMALCVIIGVPVAAFALGHWAKQWPAPKLPTVVVRMTIVLAFTAAGLITINRIRVAYLQANVLTQHPWLAWAFLPLNFFILGVCALLAYLATDPEPGFAEARRKVDKQAEKIHSLDSKFRRLVHGFEIKKAALRQACIQGISYYRMHNRRNRTNSPPRYFDDPNDPNHLPTLPTFETPNYAFDGTAISDKQATENKVLLLPAHVQTSTPKTRRNGPTSTGKKNNYTSGGPIQ